MRTRMFATAAAGITLLAALLGGPRAAGAPSARLVSGDGLELYLEIEAEGTLAGEGGLRYSSGRFAAVRVEPGPDFPADKGGAVAFDMYPAGAGCPAEDLDAGLTFAWYYTTDGTWPLPAGKLRILKIVFEPAASGRPGSCDVEFADCWGPAEAPVRNVVTDAEGKSVPFTGEGASLPCGVQFRRGDTNGDGTIDLSDAISLICLLFMGSCDLPTCLDAADVDDGGSINISDPIVLLGYLFLRYDPPPPPYPGCGPDPTPDDLTCEEYRHCE
jgi:hypothetical protein